MQLSLPLIAKAGTTYRYPFPVGKVSLFNCNQYIFLNTEPERFGVVEQMGSVAFGYTFFHVHFPMVCRVVDSVHTSSVKSNRIKRCEDTYISHLCRFRM